MNARLQLGRLLLLTGCVRVQEPRAGSRETATPVRGRNAGRQS